MNDNALTKRSTIKITKTDCGQCKCGFSKTDGVTMSDKEYYRLLKQNGYTVEKTKHGVFIYK